MDRFCILGSCQSCKRLRITDMLMQRQCCALQFYTSEDSLYACRDPNSHIVISRLLLCCDSTPAYAVFNLSKKHVFTVKKQICLNLRKQIHLLALFAGWCWIWRFQVSDFQAQNSSKLNALICVGFQMHMYLLCILCMISHITVAEPL